MTVDDAIIFEGATVEDAIYPDDEIKPDGLYEESKPTEQSERKPEQIKRRTSAAEILSMAVAGIGTYLQSSGRDVPVGRALAFEAPLAGVRLDAMIAGTVIDRILQPFVSKAELAEELGALIALPVLIGLYERHPEMGPMLDMPIHQVIRQVLLQTAPLLKKQQREEKAAVKTLEDVNEAFQMPPGMNPVDAVFFGFFMEQQGENNAPGN